MRVIGVEVLTRLCEKYPSCRGWVNNWLSDMRGLAAPSVITQRYASVKVAPERFFIFTFFSDGVQYFMKAQVAQGTGILAVKWAGSSVEYTRYTAEAGHEN